MSKRIEEVRRRQAQASRWENEGQSRDIKVLRVWLRSGIKKAKINLKPHDRMAGDVDGAKCYRPNTGVSAVHVGDVDGVGPEPGECLVVMLAYQRTEYGAERTSG